MIQKLQKHLGTMITLLDVEEQSIALSDEPNGMGQCLEFMLSERVPLMLLGLAKGNNPNGLLKLGLKFMISLMTTV